MKRARDLCCMCQQPYTTAEFREEDLAAWMKGKHIQDALPYLSADDREFLMTRICPACFPKDEED